MVTCFFLPSDVPFIFVLSPGTSVPTVISAGDLTTVNLLLLYFIQWFSVFTFVLSSLVCGSLDMQH